MFLLPVYVMLFFSSGCKTISLADYTANSQTTQLLLTVTNRNDIEYILFDCGSRHQVLVNIEDKETSEGNSIQRIRLCCTYSQTQQYGSFYNELNSFECVRGITKE